MISIERVNQRDALILHLILILYKAFKTRLTAHFSFVKIISVFFGVKIWLLISQIDFSTIWCSKISLTFFVLRVLYLFLKISNFLLIIIVELNLNYINL